MDDMSRMQELQPARRLTASFVHCICREALLKDPMEAYAHMQKYDTEALAVRHHIHHLC